MIEVGCPSEVGETFAVELDALELEVGAIVRPIEREGLAELAESIARVGQLAPILVYWTGERFRLAAGFRRVLAMGSHRDRFGFVAVLARRVDADAADLVRLVENFERKNPSTFDTCRYLYELNAGLNGRQKRAASEVAEAIGRSTHYVHNLIRFYRVLPEAVRSVWAADGDRRFMLRVLNELSKLADSGDDNALRTRVEEILTVEPTPIDPSPLRAPCQRGMTLARVTTLLRALEAAGEESIQADERASVAVALLRAISGEAQASVAEQTIQGLLADLGVRIGTGGRAMVRRVQQRDAEDWRDEIRRLARMARAFELEDRKSETWKGHVRAYAAALTTLIDPAMDNESRALLRANRVAEHCRFWTPPKLVRPRDPILDVLGVADLPMESFEGD